MVCTLRRRPPCHAGMHTEMLACRYAHCDVGHAFAGSGLDE